MSKKFEICSATYNIAFNQDANDVFGTGCTHLYQFIHGNGKNGRSGVYKPMMLKMHLELNELIEETEQQIVEPSNSNNAERPFIQQIEAKFQNLENSLQARDDVLNKIIERLEKKLEKNLSNNIVTKETDVGFNTIDHESNNTLFSSSDNAARQFSQLGKEIKALKDCIEKLVNNKAVNESADIGNPTTPDNSTEKRQQQANSSQKPSKNGNNGSDDHSDGKEYQTTPKKKKEIQFDKDKLVVIWSIKSSDSSLETAIHNVIKLAKVMNLSLTPDQIKHIDVSRICRETFTYYVFFRTKTIKETFLMKSDILERSPHNLTIRNESEYNSVFIRNFKSSDEGYEWRIANVIGLAKQMGLTLVPDEIKHINVFRVNQSSSVCRVELHTTQMENEFLTKSHILKELPASKSFEIY